MEDREWPAYVAEFIGTFLLVFFICAILSINSSGGIGVTDFAVIGLLHALVLAMLVYTLGGASGAHFNPAVTTTLLALRKIKPGDALVYVLVQLSGGVAGALVCKGLLTDAGRGVHYGATSVSQIVHGHALPGLIAEIEQPGGEPADGERRNDVGEWDQRFDRGFVAQIGQSHTIERDPHNRRREDIQPKIKQVEQDDQREWDGA